MRSPKEAAGRDTAGAVLDPQRDPARGRRRAAGARGARPARGGFRGHGGAHRRRVPASRSTRPTRTRSSSTSACPTPTAATSSRRSAREAIGAPVIFLTARDALPDRLAGLRGRRRRLPHEAVRLRRARRAAPRPRQARRHRSRVSRRAGCGSTLAPTRPRAAGATIDLTPTEFRILARLAGAPGDAVRRRELVRAGVAPRSDRPRQHARRVHRRASAASSRPSDGAPEIATVHGVGYSLR